jgi:hypothetical protein
MTKSTDPRLGAGVPAASSPKTTINTGETARPSASAIVTLTHDRRHELLLAAQFAGAPEDMLLELKRVLSREDLTADKVSKIEKRIEELAAERKQRCKTYYVREHSSVFFHGGNHKAGAPLLLTDEEAEQMADTVTSQKPPPPQPQVNQRVGGQYRVKGPGSVWRDSKLQPEGTLLDLTAEDAQSLGEAVEYVHPEG